MNQIKQPQQLLFLLLFILTGISCTSKQNKEQTTSKELHTDSSKLNVIFIMTDDQGYGDIGAHGNTMINTPNIDALYLNSAHLTNYHVNPTCSPTRAALLTGMDANRTGVWHTIAGRSLLDSKFKTIASVLNDAGWETSIFGKWHLGDHKPFRPVDHGFKESLILQGGGIGQTPDVWNNDYFDDTYLHNGLLKKYEGYCTDVWFDQAIAYMEEKQKNNQPFFTYIATNAAHHPFNVHEEYSRAYINNKDVPNANFYGMISNIDENMGKLDAFLKSSGLDQNTIVIFTTDNGTAGGVQWQDDKQTVPKKGYNASMRSTKGSMYEGGHRVPMFIKWPGITDQQTKDINTLTAHIDIFPTILDFLDVKQQAGLNLEGESLMGLLKFNKGLSKDRIIITDSQRKELPEKWRNSAVMQNNWRLINGTALYNVENDPSQTIDISQEFPKKVDELRQAYESHWKKSLSYFDNFPSIQIEGNDPITFTIHDMHTDSAYNSVAWNQRLVRVGMESRGKYAIEFMEAGTYEIRAFRYDPALGLSLNASVAATEALPNTSVKAMAPGKSLNIIGAIFKIGEQSKTVSVDRGSNIYAAATFNIPKGKTMLRSEFIAEGNKVFGSFYTQIIKKS